MITLTIEIEGAFLTPSFDGTAAANDQERELFLDLLERLAPGIDLDGSADEWLDYLGEELVGAHDEPEEEDPTTTVVS